MSKELRSYDTRVAVGVAPGFAAFGQEKIVGKNIGTRHRSNPNLSPHLAIMPITTILTIILVPKNTHLLWWAQ